MAVPFLAYDHVQLAMPAGREDDARAFYAEDADVPGTRRAFVNDPFGNRIELIAA
jgi:hypothetical protein